MKKFVVILLVFLSMASLQAFANEEINNVTISRIYIDPEDIVALTNTDNGCGSTFFHLQRTNANFREMHAYMFMAFKNQTPINFEVFDGCIGDGSRRAISHGSMSAP